MKSAILVAVISLVTTHLFAQGEVLRKKEFNLDDGVALSGYDPVSYFQGKPVEGKDNIFFVFKGVTYHFSTAANLETFKVSPEKFEPAFGGWCAYAMGETGEKVKIDPETFKIVDGRLFLFYNFWGNNTLKSWNKNETVLKAKADHNWKTFFHITP